MRTQRQLDRLIKSVTALQSKSGKDKNLAAFTSAFYAQGVMTDLAGYSTPDLAAIARSALQFATQRVAGRPKMRVFAPDLERDGWVDRVTVIEIINDDMPFLVDSILSLLNEKGHEIQLVLHPMLAMYRHGDGDLSDKGQDFTDAAPSIPRESIIHIHIDQLDDARQIKDLEKEIERTLKDIRIVVLDWQPMQDRLDGAVSSYQTNPPPVAVDELAESIQFLQWLLDNHFTFLGIREYRFEGDAATSDLKAVPKSGLGILRDPGVQVLRRGRELVSISPEVREFLMQPAPLIITKANVRATVHRRVHMDYIGVKQFDRKGALTGELRIVGLFTSVAYTRSVRMIPMLRRKVAHVMDRTGYSHEGHSSKALHNIIEQFPRDELIQIDEDTLLETATGILQLEERPRTRLFVRKDKFDRFVSALVYIPRDRFNTTVRKRVGDALAQAYEGRLSAFFPDFPEGSLVRVHFIIGRDEGATPSPDLDLLEADIVEIVKTWDDRLTEAIIARCEPQQATYLIKWYVNAFSAAYQDAFDPYEALSDIDHIGMLADGGDVEIDLYRRGDDAGHALRLKIYHLGEPIPLSDRLPILENMGLRAIDERSYRAEFAEAATHNVVWIHDITLETADGAGVALEKIKAPLEACYLAVWAGRAENDHYNTLVLKESMDWRDVSMLRAYSRYLRQTGITYSDAYMSDTICTHAPIARKMVNLFYDRFELANDGRAAGTRSKKILRDVEEDLQQVASLGEDRILRRFINAMTSSLRTNFFQTDESGSQRPAIAVKFRSSLLEDLPEPKPFAEIFVYAPDVEGVHLRFGMIARGGLRWSDRPEDFRTEVLGLVKAQQVKNAVIVPVGSKGGFVPKKLSQMTTRETFMEEGIRCYKIFISSLLDVTDNLKADGVVPPNSVVRHDGDDAYLVVAADKGTATFSDIANGISEDRGHWLGDAFASGGSAGYDHKKMGITARGAWEAVKRHFREMDIDIQSTPFTAIGVGDMSGDVFGNGMLLSKHTKLLAAFDHRDIFIDPDPDPATSWKERQRLFKAARLTWQDYDASLISKGGGVFSRSLKSLDLSDEICRLAGLKSKKATPIELIQALLRSDADLLWFGGIGTYARATSETDDDAGDRANDAVRITAKELKVKVIGEGANLGLTQLARIEFAANGGRANTDAVDNSAGVNSSDVEVNIKIAVGAAEEAGLLTRPARNKLLSEMTGEVAQLCLTNNYLQTLSITLAEVQGREEMGFNLRLMRNLEQAGLLDREIEFLPDDVEMAERESHNQALVRPELSVLLAYAKITTYDELLNSDLLEDPYFGDQVMNYFPTRLQKRFPEQIRAHRLRREIIATRLANRVINRGGPSFVNRLSDDTGADVAAIVSAFTLAHDSFGFAALYKQVDALDNKVASEVQIDLYLLLQDLLRRQTMWFLRNAAAADDLGTQVDHYRSALSALEGSLEKVLPAAAMKGVDAYQKQLHMRGVPRPLAETLARLKSLARGPDIVLIAAQNKWPVQVVARVYFNLGEELNISQIADRSSAVQVRDYFERVAVNRTLDGIFASQRALTAEILTAAGKNEAKAWDNWSTENGPALTRVRGAIEEMVMGDVSLAKLTVASSYLSDLSIG
jgi:glutamate dehydrogenase